MLDRHKLFSPVAKTLQGTYTSIYAAAPHHKKHSNEGSKHDVATQRESLEQDLRSVKEVFPEE